MSLIRLEDITKTYHLGEIDVPVLRGVSIEIKQGELVALMGASGSGKTTLMNLLGCLDHPTSGRHWFEDEEISGYNADQRANLRNRKIGFVFQSFNLLPRTNALEQVIMPLTYAVHKVHDWEEIERGSDLLASVGLADFGRPDGYLARQVKRWHAQWRASETSPRPELDELVERLTATMPAQGAPAIVHGDYRLTNVIYRTDVSGIAAVVDWEMATLGDPLADVGLLAVYHRLAAVSDGVMPAMSPANGFLSAEQMAARYADAAGRDLSQLDWYIAFGYYKLAVISEGIHYRYLQGKTVGEGFSQMGDRVPQLLDAALGLLAGR